MTWFEKLTGCAEESPEQVRRDLNINGGRLHSRVNGRSWLHGELETPTLGQLRERVRRLRREPKPNTVSEVVGNVLHLHRLRTNEHALFQVASQFNLLEMTSPSVTPERGVGIYERDFTQGPACAIAAGAGTIYRNNFVDVDGRTGQSAHHQIDCLSGIGALLGNTDQRLWRMTNGYALPSESGLIAIHWMLQDMDDDARDAMRQALRIGLHWDTQVTIDIADHTVTQAYCSAMPVAYTNHAVELWAPFARLILEAAYEATICAGILNAERDPNSRLFLTLLGGGVFGNDPEWIFGAMRRALERYSDAGLDIAIVSFGSSNRAVRELVDALAR